MATAAHASRGYGPGPRRDRRDGTAYHAAERVQKDKDRDNLNLAADGIQTYRFGPVNVTERACESAAMVAESLRRSGWEGQPHPCRRPGCVVGRRLTAA
jgi:hypothetical protein